MIDYHRKHKPMRIATAEWANPAEVEERYLYRDGLVWLWSFGRVKTRFASATEDDLACGPCGRIEEAAKGQV